MRHHSEGLQNRIAKHLLPWMVILFLLPHSKLYSQYDFRRYSINDGLSSNSVLAVEMDAKGYLWAGTYYGINRFDGQNFKQYFFDNHTIDSKDQVSDIFSDSKGRLWVGTFSSLYLYDDLQDEFIKINEQPVNVGEIAESPANTIWIVGYGAYIIDDTDLTMRKVKMIGGNDRKIEDIEFDRWDRIWLGWFDDGVTMCRYVKLRDEEELYIEKPFNSQNSFSLNSDIVRDLFIDQAERLWVTTYEGLNYIDLSSSDSDLKIQEFTGGFSKSRFWSVAIDSHGLIWAGSYGDGLFVVEPGDEGEIINIKTDLLNPRSISCNEIHAIMEDSYGNIWIASENGLNKVIRGDLDYKTYYYIQDNPNSLSSNHICEIYQDPEGKLWMGTSTGLSMWDYNRNDEIFKRYYLSDSGYAENYILSLAPTGNKDQFYIGCRDGLYIYEPGKKAQKINTVRHRYNKSILTVRNILEIGSRLWLATDNGIHIYDHESDEFAGYVNFDLADLDCQNIICDTENTVWLATNYGVRRIMNPLDDVTSFKVREYSLDTINKGSESAYVTSILQDENGMVWAGTYEGIFRLDPASGSYRHFNSQNGLREDFIAGCLEYKDKIIVLGLSSISSIRQQDFVIESYSFNTAITNERETFYLTLLQDGNLALGGINGLKILNPDELNHDTVHYPLLIQELRVGAKSIKPAVDRKSEIFQSISTAERIYLDYKSNTFSLEFSSLYFSDPVKFMYAYKMEDYDEDWMYVNHNQGYANYSKLSPGNYLFRVNATNSIGQWNQEDTILEITVLPPIWMRWYAILFYIACLIVLLVFVRNELSIRYKLATEKLAKKEIEKQNADQMQFFINISHELKTPLAMINGPLEYINKHLDSENELYKYSDWALSNAYKLTAITNEILDLRLLNVNKLQPSDTSVEWKEFIETIYGYFTQMARRRNIRYSLENSIDQGVVFDVPMIEKSIVNLLDNAFKYAPDRAEITLKSFLDIGKKEGKDWIHVICSNTGSFISPDDLEKVFERFYRAEKNDAGGSGIGLSITKQFIELHQGKIWCESDYSTGVDFHVLIPLVAGSVREQDIASSSNEVIYKRIYGIGPNTDPKQTFLSKENIPEMINGNMEPDIIELKEEATEADLDNRPLILVVEDDLRLRDFIVSILEKNYRLLSAADGKDAYQIIISKVHPDLVISDIMMPVMNGFTLCDRIKGDEFTSHIPIILLTARPEKYSLLDSYMHEANAYIEKPFSQELLTFCIKSILHQHEILRKHYSNTLVDFHRNEDDQDSNRVFLESVKMVILENIDNSELNIQTLCKELSISQYMLYNKLKAIAGKTPGQIIKTIRIHKAAHLIRKGNHSIKEIQYHTGFNSSKSLRDAFKEEFGVLPSQYREQIEI
jgi:signal transduction histidine kinase/ligand-binding sensor domain-containing protein/CheY-like chemotaxis protein